MPITIPNLLTSFRIAAIPLIVVIYYLPFPWASQASGIIFGLAAITDWLGGYLARSLNQTTRFGAFLDPDEFLYLWQASNDKENWEQRGQT